MRHRTLRLFPSVLFAVLTLIASATPPQTDEQIFRDMPSSADVLSKVQGDDPLDTYARQLVAFDGLSQLITLHQMTEYRTELPPGLPQGVSMRPMTLFGPRRKTVQR